MIRGAASVCSATHTLRHPLGTDPGPSDCFYVYQCVPAAQRPKDAQRRKEGSGSPAGEGADCEPSYRCWDLRMSPLEEQPCS